MEQPVAAPAEGGEQPQQGFSIFGFLKNLMWGYMMFSMVTSFFKPQGGQQAGNYTAKPAGVPAMNLFQMDEIFDLYVYLDAKNATFNIKNPSNEPFWVKKGMRYDDWTSGDNQDGSYTMHKTFATPDVLLKNQSMYLHTFVVKTGTDVGEGNAFHKVIQLNKYMKKHYRKTSNLLTGKSEQSEDDLKKAEIMDFEILNHWHPNISISLIVDSTQWTQGAIPGPLANDIVFTPSGRFYQPIIFMNTWWNLKSDYQPINDTVKELNLTVTYYPMGMIKYQMYASQKVQNEWSMMGMGGGGDEEDSGHDQVKIALLETNPVLLVVTMLVSILHTVFEMLAFKNDIQFWKEKKDLVGLSVKSVLFNIFQSLIVFLYICDNETNTMVKVTVGIGLLIECWKIPKVLNVELDRENMIFGVIPRVKFSDKGSYVESDTKVYDEMAFRYLGMALFPLLVGYAIYSVIYVEQKGWYSWVLNMLYGFLLTFGFITMTPQLFINYKLKSVAHLPWRMLTYKFINTFIDDLFAFVIRMPLLYRIGCFRDDIIFIIYLYQRWAYRVDPKRKNEFGTSGENEAIVEQEPAAIEEDKKTK